MNDEQPSTEDHAVGGRQLSRRTVLRTAAHAAWAVPAIQIVAAAPSFAASGDALALTPAPTGVWDLVANRMTATIRVKNMSAANPTVGLQLTVIFPNVYVYKTRNRTLRISNVTSGWRAGRVSYSGSGTGRTATVVFTASSQVAPGATSTLGFRATVGYDIVAGDIAAANDTVTGAATATGFTSARARAQPDLTSRRRPPRVRPRLPGVGSPALPDIALTVRGTPATPRRIRRKRSAPGSPRPVRRGCTRRSRRR